jgi:type II secretory ATPase GspE/PulE/Tfp pilus assembly ATPase PilB-like protein
MTFGKALKAFLRQDPDIIMVGEMRDLETAQISIQASLTGHLVLSTLHTQRFARRRHALSWTWAWSRS